MLSVNSDAGNETDCRKSSSQCKDQAHYCQRRPVLLSVQIVNKKCQSKRYNLREYVVEQFVKVEYADNSVNVSACCFVKDFGCGLDVNVEVASYERCC